MFAEKKLGKDQEFLDIWRRFIMGHYRVSACRRLYLPLIKLYIAAAGSSSPETIALASCLPCKFVQADTTCTGCVCGKFFFEKSLDDFWLLAKDLGD